MKPSFIITSRQQAVLRRLSKVHILILDSSTQVTNLFKNMLKEFGFDNVYTANTGFQGVQILKQAKINLIITDWELKLRQEHAQSSTVISHTEILDLSGVEFVRRLRQSPNSPNPFIPVIMFADAVEELHAITARDAGADEIIIKPLQAKEFCRRLVEIIDKPRIFITADTYKGPCRRRKDAGTLEEQSERRKREIRIVKRSEGK